MSQVSQDLFGDNNAINGEQGLVPVPEKLLKDILKELKHLRESIDELKKTSTRPQDHKDAQFRVEDQGFHKAYFQFLKGQFCACPWLDTKNEDFKREVKQYIGDHNPHKFKVMSSYASHKFTQLRNQLRRMLFHSTLDMQALSLEGLCNYLYRPFTPPGESPVDQKRMRMAVAIRAFLVTKKFQETSKFWVEFKEFYDAILGDNRQNIWDLLQEKEEKRIKRYPEEQDRE